MTVPVQHITDKDFLVVLDVVRYVREHEKAVFNRYLREETMIDVLIDYVAAYPGTPTINQIIDELRTSERAEAWLVEIPIANLTPPSDALPLGPTAMLVKTSENRNRSPLSSDDPPSYFAVRQHLGVPLMRRSRWLPGSDGPDGDVDTRFTASLVLVEHGTEGVAMSLAETRARLALALWCLLSPPASRKQRLEQWPSVSRWAPSPHLYFRAVRARYRPETHTTQIGAGQHVTRFSPYRLTANPEILQAPFVAMEKAQKRNDAALAILSAARSLHIARAERSDLERTERALHLWAAHEALCDPGRKGKGKADKRWERLVENLRVRDAVTRHGYTRGEADAAMGLIEDVRNTAAHRTADVLVNLSFPHDANVRLHLGKRRRDRLPAAHDFGLVRLVSSYPIAYTLVATAARCLAKRAIKNGWNESDFHRCFS